MSLKGDSVCRSAGDFSKVFDQLRCWGGDPGFLQWMTLGHRNIMVKKFPWEAPRLERVRSLASDLRSAMEAAGAPFSWDTELRRLLYRVEFAAALRELWLKGHVKRLKLRQPGSGLRPKRMSVYAWLGALVPFTAALDSRLRPRWTWINEWLSFVREGAVDSQRLWTSAVRDKVRLKKPIDPDLVEVLAEAAHQYITYVDQLADLGDEEERVTPTAGRYRRAVGRHMPFLRKML